MTARSAKVIGRDRSCTAFARERRWSETDLRSKEGGRGSKGEEGDGEESSSGIITGGVEGGGQTHLGLWG